MKQPNVPSASKALSDSERRRRLIQDQPAALGVSWALDSCQDALQNGRKIEGGWPGTVPEARMRVQRTLARELAQHGLPPLSHGELVAATATVYDRAKREWHLAGKARHGKPTLLAAEAGARKDGR